MVQDKLSKEIKSFDGLWEGGYYEGNPLNYLGRSAYGSYGYISFLHAIYLRCIKPYINSETVALENRTGTRRVDESDVGVERSLGFGRAFSGIQSVFRVFESPEKRQVFSGRRF